MTQPANELNEQVERLIVRYLDGEATDAERSEVETLLASNGAARALYEDFVAIDADSRDALSAAFVTVPANEMQTVAVGFTADHPCLPPHRHDQITGRINFNQNARASLATLLTWGGALAAAAMILLYVWSEANAPTVAPDPAIPMIAENAPHAPRVPAHEDGVRYVSIPDDWPADRPIAASEAWRHTSPVRNVVGVQRNVVGLHDPKTNNVYMIELDRRAMRTTPVVFDN
jgi:hypothetical protein